jgi:DNA-binding response OmpR family regulator
MSPRQPFSPPRGEQRARSRVNSAAVPRERGFGIAAARVSGRTDAAAAGAAQGAGMGRSVLVVEDERKIRELLRGYLERAGFGVYSTASGADAIDVARTRPLDLVVLDLGLPDVPGAEVLREVRRASDVPVLVLTARATEDDRIRGLELGADDYVTKPFSPREVVLRARAILRRGRGDDRDGDAAASFGGGELTLDEARRTATVRGEPVSLTPTEWGILVTLAGTPGRVFSRFELVNRVRGYEFDGYERTIDSHVKNLRRKVERDPHLPAVVQTVLGSGYRLGLARDG